MREPAAQGQRGRQSEARRNDRALLDAARLVFAVHGPDAPVAAVAAEAGVGIASLYRRHPSKEALLQHLCLSSMQQLIDAAEVALEGENAWEGFAGFVRGCASFRAGAFDAIAGSIPTTTPIIDAAERGHELSEKIVERAQRDGGLRPDVTTADVHLIIELFSRRRADDDSEYERALVIALDGLRAPSATLLPGEPPTRERYASRWRQKR